MDERRTDEAANDGASGAADTWPLSAREAAVVLGVSERTVRRAIARGDLPATIRADVYRIAPSDLARYRARRRMPTALAVRRRTDPPWPISLPKWAGDVGPTLPLPLTPLIGRAHEIAHVSDLLGGADHPKGTRLVTLLGPGGVGKTRLALQVAADLRDAFPDGVWFVDLAPLTDPALVASAIAGVLGVRETGGQALTDRLRRYLALRKTLLLLDNFEAVPAAASTVATLLATCPRLTVLATSRVPLHLSGEQRFPVPSLRLPDPEPPWSLEDLAAVEAIALFCARARAVLPSFALTAAIAADVVAICRRLDGLPLAIELAAAHSGVLPPPALFARLESPLSLLTGGPQDQPARLQTMRAAIAWSHNLLTEPEQALFRRLAVFAGGFTLEAAEAVANAADEPPVAAFEALSSLVEKNLVRLEMGADHEAGSGDPRFGMLETIREFGLERLIASGEEAIVRDRHAAWCLALAEGTELWGPEPQRSLDVLEADRDNLRAALAWATERGDPATGLCLACELTWFWKMRGAVGEGNAWFRRLLARMETVAPAVQARALTQAGDMARTAGDVDRAIALLEAARARWLAAGDPPGTGGWGAATGILGVALLDRGDDAGAQALLEAALAAARRNRDWGDLRRAAIWLENLATVHRRRGDYLRTGALLSEAMSLCRQVGFAWEFASLLARLGDVAHLLGDQATAAARYRESLAAIGPDGDKRSLAGTLAGFAAVAAACGAPDRAARLCGAVAALLDATGAVLSPAGQTSHERAVRLATDVMGERAFAEARCQGRSMPLPDVLAEVARPLPATRPVQPDGGPDDLPPRDPNLSPRELEVLRLIAVGRSNREIAEALGITLLTAKTHVAHLFAKLGVGSRAAAGAYAHRRGLA